MGLNISPQLKVAENSSAKSLGDKMCNSEDRRHEEPSSAKLLGSGPKGLNSSLNKSNVPRLFATTRNLAAAVPPEKRRNTTCLIIQPPMPKVEEVLDLSAAGAHDEGSVSSDDSQGSIPLRQL